MQDAEENAEWILSSVQGLQFRKLRTIRIGDQMLTATTNISHDNNNNSRSRIQLPRSWMRLLENHILLSRELNATLNQLEHYLHVTVRSLFEDEPRHFLNLLESNMLGNYGQSLYTRDVYLIQKFLNNELNLREKQDISRHVSLADSTNRKNDRTRVQSSLYLPELGYNSCNIHFYNNSDDDSGISGNSGRDSGGRGGGELIAVNYERIVYGDHGPYIEFRKDQIEWDSFPQSKDKGASISYYDEYHTADGNVKLYAQRKTVSDQPNPPPGKYSVHHNRAEGYADYKVGYYYISPDDLTVDLAYNDFYQGVNNNSNSGDSEYSGNKASKTPYLYLLSKHSENRKYNRNQRIDAKQRNSRWNSIKNYNRNRNNNNNNNNNRNNNSRNNRKLASVNENGSVNENEEKGFVQGYSQNNNNNRNANTNPNDDTMSVISSVSTAVATVAPSVTASLPDNQGAGGSGVLDRYNEIMGKNTRNTRNNRNNKRNINASDATFVSNYNPKILHIKLMKTPQIRTEAGKQALKDCRNGTYIPGLIFLQEFITEHEEKQIMNYLIDNSDIWRLCKIQQKRRSLQFGWHLDYDSMELYPATPDELSKIPDELEWIPKRIQKTMETMFDKDVKEFNQLILNEYAPNQGISQHTDRTHVFGPVVAGLSLFTPCVIEFIDKRQRGKNRIVKPILLPPRSVFIMTGESRYDYTHGIPAKKEVNFYGHTIRRGVRYSMTFRHAIAHSSEVLSRSSYNAVSADAMSTH